MSGALTGAALVVATHFGAFGSQTNTARRVVTYAPGIRIDWSDRRVEVDGRVVLRDGPLELFACSPGTREHESVVVVDARPLKIYEAMGLIGLTPGHPIREDKGSGRWLAATGDRVRITVQWTADDRTRIEDIGEWMKDVKSDKPVPGLQWVFAGSYPDEKYGFMADSDGTVICVVDFASALVALPEMRTADNEALWLAANTDAIPPMDTPVTLRFEPVDAVRLVCHIDARGQIHVEDRRVTLEELPGVVKTFAKRHASGEIEIQVASVASGDAVDRTIAVIRKAATPTARVRVVKEAASGETVDRPTGNPDSDAP